MDVWERARAQFDGLAHGEGLNLAFEAVDRHVAHGRGDRIAFRFIAEDASVRSLSYAELSRLSNRFANVVRSLGLQSGDIVFSFAGRIPEVYVAALGSLKAGAVFSALFANFGQEPVRIRLAKGHGKLLLTTGTLYRRRVAGLHDSLPMLRVLVAGGDVPADVPSYDRLMQEADESFAIGPTDPEHPAFLHFTSGTTGMPKGAVHVHAAAVAHYSTARTIFGLREDDVYWCTADPGWVTGISYGLSAPLLHGVTTIVYEGEFDPAGWYRAIQDHRVTVWYTAPTAIRMLMRAGAKLARSFDLSSLRIVASVGEPLSPDAIRWARQALGQDIHDTWWQTETGAIMIGTSAEDEIVLGAIGRPLPGVEAAIACRRGGQMLDFIEVPDQVGELVLKAGWPSMFRGYLDEPELYAQCFAQGWYLTGDLVCRDEQGRFSFVSRGDELIKSAGQLIGPFEVESSLLEHPAVAEVGAIGKPDPVVGETVKAFVSLKDNVIADENLRLDLLAFARKRLGPALAPREITFCRDLPKTRNGKIVRRLLKARELGIPEVDLSSLDPTE